jgi:hypothetical protein
MIVAAKKHALAIEAAALKQMERQRLGKSGKKVSPIQPPEEVFETACFSFIQNGNELKSFMKALPTPLGSERLFAVLILQSVFRLCRDWILEAMNSAPEKFSQSSTRNKQESGSFHVLVTVDMDSEVHRFVGSAACTEIKAAKKEMKELKKSKEQSDSLKRINSIEEKIKRCESKLALLNDVGIKRDRVPERHDSSYDSPVLEARNQGGLLYVSPKFLGWAKELMSNIRSAITKDLIHSLGKHSQRRAYDHVNKNSKRQALFHQKVKDLSGEYTDEVVESVRRRLVNFSFHAWSNVEWKKYKKENTDRTAGKEKKMG